MQHSIGTRPGDARIRRFPLGARVTVKALAGDPYPLFHELRAAEPVTWVPELGMWMLTRRDDIVRVLADWERFTTDSPASTIRDIFGSHMLTTDGEPQIRHKRRFITPFPERQSGAQPAGSGSDRARSAHGGTAGCQASGGRPARESGAASLGAEHLWGAGAPRA